MTAPPRRRTPNFLRFLITGGVLGIIVGVIVSVTGPDAKDYDAGTQIGYLAAFGLLIGLGVSGLIAIAIDAWLRRGSSDK